MDREVDVEVPFHAKGRALGVQKGGTLHETLRSLPVRATPDKIPADIVVDVTPLDVNGLIRVQDLELPEGVTVLSPPHRTLITIMPEEKKGGSAASGDSGDKGAKKKKK
jgi:large subunit ribosomal protein L25